mmetsp:Transcript_18767/g.24778  ORF Transcript_18767/g.24778 Transcript_18767/m.24778 type:complete len:336 (+) Transcript_18767:70-1077(+)
MKVFQATILLFILLLIEVTVCFMGQGCDHKISHQYLKLHAVATRPRGSSKAKKPKKGAGKGESYLDKEMRKATKKFQSKEQKKENVRRSKMAANDARQRKESAEMKSNKREAPWKTVEEKAPIGKDKTAVIKRHWQVDDISSFEFLGGFTTKLPNLNLPEIAFLGRSNVGKSSLLNTLQGGAKKIAKVSKMPGRTQMINLFTASTITGSEAVAFADLPGYGYAKISQESKDEITNFLSKYFDSRESLKCAILLLDVRREPQESDISILNFLEDCEIPTTVVATKIDKLSKAEAERQLQLLNMAFDLPDGLPIPFSSVTGEGRNEVWHTIKEACMR